jgi:spermidine synthase
LPQLPIAHHWLTLPMVTNAFEFSRDFYQNSETVPINYLGSHAIYQLHQKAWQDQQGLNNAHLQ